MPASGSVQRFSIASAAITAACQFSSASRSRRAAAANSSSASPSPSSWNWPVTRLPALAVPPGYPGSRSARSPGTGSPVTV